MYQKEQCFTGHTFYKICNCFCIFVIFLNIPEAYLNIEKRCYASTTVLTEATHLRHTFLN